MYTINKYCKFLHNLQKQRKVVNKEGSKRRHLKLVNADQSNRPHLGIFITWMGG